MKKVEREALDAYYREAGSWAEDQRAALVRSRRIAWIVAGVAVAMAAMLALAILFLTPLKTVEPYTLLVDRNTGYVQALKPIDAEKIAPDRALTQSFLVQYVIARESYDFTTVQGDYRKVMLWSAEGARTTYANAMQATNPESPLARYPRTATLQTRVKSVSPLDDGAALVRFETQLRDQAGRATAPQSWVSVVRYRYSTAPMSTADRFVNPLGFQVVRYRRDAEVLAPAAETGIEPETTPVAVEPVPARTVRLGDRAAGRE
ncbi:MAG: hypothetical protein HEQ22_07490 [Sphingopyxis sp.]|uniref:virB8 family protein n=1 Tax=Sphingopyxis sp. TaxID=1908224 RepID=UPI003D812198